MSRRNGPGTELKLLLESLGIGTLNGCSCGKVAALMDSWGPDGCDDPANREAILRHLRAAQREASWRQLIRAAAHALASGIAFRLDPTDPAPGLLDEAIRRARLRPPGSV